MFESSVLTSVGFNEEMFTLVASDDGEVGFEDVAWSSCAEWWLYGFVNGVVLSLLTWVVSKVFGFVVTVITMEHVMERIKLPAMGSVAEERG
jgi:hypothetical protein